MSLFKNLSYNLLLSSSQILFPILTIPYLARIIEPANIGKVSFIDSYAYYFVVIAEFGITSYGIREVARRRNDKKALDTLVSELFFLHILASAITLLAFIISTALLYQKFQDNRLINFSIVFLLSNCFTFDWYFWGKEEFKYIALRSLFIRILGVVAIFILVQKNEDYFIYYAIITGTAFLNATFNFKRILRGVNIRFYDIDWRRHIPKVFISYLISLFYSSTLFLDSVLVGIISTTAALAFYHYSMKVVRIASGLITDSLLVFYPRTVVLLHDEQQSEFQNSVIYSSQIIILTSIPMCAGIILLSEVFTRVYFGRTFLPVADNLKILAFIPLIKSLSLFFNKQLLMPFDKERLVLNGLMIGTLFFIPSMLIFCFFFSFKGAAISILISEIVILCVNYYYVKKIHKNLLLLDMQTVVQALTAVLFFFPVIYVTNYLLADEIIKLLISIITCALVYMLLLTLVLKNKMVLLFLSHFKKSFIIKH